MVSWLTGLLNEHVNIVGKHLAHILMYLYPVKDAHNFMGPLSQAIPLVMLLEVHTVEVNKMLTQSPVWYCCGTAAVLFRYCYGTATVLIRYGSVQFSSRLPFITRIVSLTREG